MADATSSKFSIFRADGCGDLTDDMIRDGVTPAIADGLAQLRDAGSADGVTVKVLYSAPGFHLSQAWFRSGYPLPRHSHNVDCLYYIISGSLSIGRETLRAGDGFFVPSEAAYTYVPGPEGVEVLEFRHAQHFNIKFLVGNPSFWQKAAATIGAERETWSAEPRPSDVRRGS